VNKNDGNAIRPETTNLRTALKKLADKHQRKVRINWKQLFLEMNNIYSSNALAFVLFVRFVLTRLPVYTSLALKLFSKQNNIFRQRKNSRQGAIFKQSSRRGVIVQRKG